MARTLQAEHGTRRGKHAQHKFDIIDINCAVTSIIRRDQQICHCDRSALTLTGTIVNHLWTLDRRFSLAFPRASTRPHLVSCTLNPGGPHCGAAVGVAEHERATGYLLHDRCAALLGPADLPPQEGALQKGRIQPINPNDAVQVIAQLARPIWLLTSVFPPHEVCGGEVKVSIIGADTSPVNNPIYAIPYTLYHVTSYAHQGSAGLGDNNDEEHVHALGDLFRVKAHVG